MKKNNIFRRLISLTVTAAMVMTIGSAVFAGEVGQLQLGAATSVTATSTTPTGDYYTFEAPITGSYTLTARRSGGSNRGKIEWSASSDFSNPTTIGDIGSNNKTATFNLTGGSTYYLRVTKIQTYGTGNPTIQITLTGNFNTTAITFNSNGGQGQMSSITVPRNHESTLPQCTFTRSGYEFAGWATDNSSSAQVVYTDGGSITPTQSTVRLYAKWNQIYTVSFDKASQYATGTVNPMTGTAGTTITLPDSGFTRDNYALIGWAESADATTPDYALGAEYTISGNKTLYAVWSRTVFDINFLKNADDATGAVNPMSGASGDVINLPDSGFSRTGYELAGWDTSSTATTPTYALGAEYTISGNADLYAVWDQIYTISFDKASQAATGTVSQMTGTAGTTITLPSSGFTRDHYALIGWSTSADATTAEYGLGAEYTISGNKTLYAVWSKTVFDISFIRNGSGASGTINSMSGASGDTITLPSSGFTRNGYVLAGWATSNTATTPNFALGAEYTISGDATLYAVWTRVYTVQFNANQGSGTVPSQTGAAGTTITLPTGGFTRNGYRLIGWSTGGTSQTIIPLGGEYTITAPYMGNTITLNAVWGHELSFDANGGTGSIDPILARYNGQVRLPSTDAGISREGYTLVGWGTSSTSTSGSNPGTNYTMPNSDRTLYAIWRGSLSFDSNGGTGSINSRALVIGATTSLPSAGVTRTGYGLRGWDTNATATTPTYRTGTDYTFTGNTTLYAVWGPTLTYNGNGGSGFIQGGTYDSNYQVQLSSNTGNQRYTRDGYTILGWARSADATAPEFGLGGTLTITEPTTLYAVWGRNLAFAPNGGTGEIPSILAVPGTTITLPETGFTRDGYTLAGWSIASDGTTKDYELGATYTVTDANVTLTAVWECTLSFDANGGEGDAMDDMTVIAGASANLPECTYTYTTYSFAGWADTPEGEPSMTYTASASTTLYAIWTERTVYNVIFNANGGEGTMASIPLTDDVTGTIPACEFTYTGYTFLGWTTDPESTTVDYVEGDPIDVVDSDVTLYALWSARDVYYVNFDANGGEGTMSPLALTDDVSGTVPACDFTRDGYTCIGWAVDADSETTDYVQGDSIRLTNDNLTLYAVWEEGVTPGPDDPDDPDDPEVPDEPVYTPEQLREMNITHFVDRLYLVALGRAYDVDGRNNWANLLLVNGNSGSDIVYGFLNSQEFIGKNLSDEEYITILYRIFFDREPDAEGMANWKKALAGGATRNDILRGFADSPEWLAYCARYQVNP